MNITYILKYKASAELLFVVLVLNIQKIHLLCCFSYQLQCPFTDEILTVTCASCLGRCIESNLKGKVQTCDTRRCRTTRYL